MVETRSSISVSPRAVRMRPSCGRFSGDVEPAHDLEPVGDGAVHRLGDAVDRVEHAVDPHADDGLLAPRLDVDVAGALLEGVVEQVLDRRDDRLARRPPARRRRRG